jgi:hypothetical protein
VARWEEGAPSARQIIQRHFAPKARLAPVSRVIPSEERSDERGIRTARTGPGSLKKKKKKKKKERFVSSSNPYWNDLYDSLHESL